MRAPIILILTLLVASTALSGEDDWLAPSSDGAPLTLPSLSPDLPPPSEALGYPLGQRFTHYDAVVSYLSRLAAASDRVAIWEYGRTYENRPLLLLAISSPENILRLDELRQRHLASAEAPQSLPDTSASAAEMPVVVWLAYGIHGNESSSTEASMAAAFALAAAGGEWNERLDDAIVLIDPLSNPDGRERYVHFFESRSGRQPDQYARAAEHQEPWPGGRQNHYLIDLNRDWAWATQRETKHRLLEYRRWEPHVYVDFHEMSAQSTYFFPPAADPIHPGIDSTIVSWLDVFGRANARAFDQQGWVYYVGEKFDLFYPGYGDSYPGLRGAVGMTYEMAGGGRAGLAIERPDGSLLTLSDRVARHLVTSLVTVETAVANRAAIVGDFLAARRRSVTEGLRSYLWDADQSEARAAAELLSTHGLEVTRLPQAENLEVSPLTGGDTFRRSFSSGTFVLSTAQPLSRLARSLMEPAAEMPEHFLADQRQRLEQNRSTEFYDITAWSIPLAFNLETFVTDRPVRLAGEAPSSRHEIHGTGELGFLVPPQGLAGYHLASTLLSRSIGTRLALAAFEQQDGAYERGTLFIPRRGNPEDLEAVLEQVAQSTGAKIARVTSGLPTSGASLGSDALVPLRLPVVGLVGGAGVEPTSYGFLWHLLDQQLELPFHQLATESLGRIDLGDFDVLVLPNGTGYDRSVSDSAVERLGRWVEAGGMLIALGAAVEWLGEREMTSVKAWEPPEDDSTAANVVPELTPARRDISTPGAALATSYASSHPLTAGLAASPAMLFQGSRILLPSGDPRRDLIVVRRDDPVAAGFVWPEVEERLRGALLVGIERKGRGALIVFAQDPVFRLFWRAGAPPLLNALLYSPSLDDYGQLFE